jgi:hypothetical protein
MARYQKQRTDYPMGSVSCATMREEDLIPAFLSELEFQAKRANSGVSAKVRKSHLALVREIEKRSEEDGYYESEEAGYDLNESLFDALDCYAAPYFYFGAHPGDGSDYGYWLSEEWDQDFASVYRNSAGVLDCSVHPFTRDEYPDQIKVSDTADIPSWFRGEVAVVNDHGNVTLYVKTSRTLREVWAVV